MPELRLARLADLRHPMSVDLWVEKVAAKARVVVVRLLGGYDWWAYGCDRLAEVARGEGRGAGAAARGVPGGRRAAGGALDGGGAGGAARLLPRGGAGEHARRCSLRLAGREAPGPAVLPRAGCGCGRRWAASGGRAAGGADPLLSLDAAGRGCGAGGGAGRRRWRRRGSPGCRSSSPRCATRSRSAVVEDGRRAAAAGGAGDGDGLRQRGRGLRAVGGAGLPGDPGGDAAGGVGRRAARAGAGGSRHARGAAGARRADPRRGGVVQGGGRRGTSGSGWRCR